MSRRSDTPLGVRSAIALLGALLLTSCAPIVRPEQVSAEREITLAAEQPIGQTFTAPHGGLTAITIPFGADDSTDGAVVLHVYNRNSPVVQDDLIWHPFTVELPTARTAAGMRTFVLPVPLQSHRRDYYIELQRLRGPPIGVGIVDAATRTDGSAYANRRPVEAQLALQLHFDPVHAAATALIAALDWLPALAAAAALLLIPGTALLRLLWPDRPAHSGLDQLGLAAAAGAALYPPLLAWTDLLGIHLGRNNFLLPIAGGVAIHILLTLRNVRRPQPAGNAPQARLPLRPGAFGLATAIALVALFASRALPVGSLALPLWGDAVHHSALAQLIVDQGGYFSSWQPYADAQSFTYHPGFHTFLAGLYSLTDLDTGRGAIFAGQIMNMLAVVAVAPLASRLSGNRWAGLVAVAVAGFLLEVPQAYTNWSRWTQLAGQMILPAAMLAVWHFLQRPNLRIGALAALLAVGLALTHYRIILLWAIFAAIVWIGLALQRRDQSILRNTAALIALACSVALLFAPWALRTWRSELARSFTAKLATPATAVPDAVRSYNDATGGPTAYIPLPFWLLAAGAAAYSARAGRRSGLLVAGWSIAVWLAANPGLLGLPGAGILSNFAINIAAYIPIAAIIGSAAPSSTFVSLAVAAAAAYGLAVRPADVQPAPHSMAAAPDVRAAQWVRSAIYDDVLIAVNGFVPTPGGYVAGTDGGWWLRVLSGRRTTIPPMQSQAETQPTPDALERVRALASLTDGSLPAEQAVPRLRALGVTHIYVGQIQGTSNHPPGGLTVAALDALPAVRAIYREDRVGLYEIR